MTALSLQLWTSKSPDALTPERFNKPQNDITRAAVHKPRGGLWTSTYDPMEGSAWLRWCKDQGFEAPPWHGFLIKPDPSAVIYMIDSVPDIELLFERYGYQPFIDLSQELITHQRLTQSLDFEKISRDFDAIHITERGHEATRFGFLEYPGWFRMFDWSCEL